MQISIQDLKLEPLGCFSDSELPCGINLFMDLPPFDGESYRVLLGNFTISRIWRLKTGEYVVQGCEGHPGGLASRFKSLHHAKLGILRRIKGKAIF